MLARVKRAYYGYGAKVNKSLPNPFTMNVTNRFPIPAFVHHNPHSEFPCLLVCEHASNYIPPEYGALGLSESEVAAHIGWDIGARELLDHLVQALECTGVQCNYSRLLIDCNRPLEVASSIPAASEIYAVPGNRDLCDLERQHRIEHIYKPFHAAVESQVQRLKAKHSVFPVIGIHSFTPVFHGAQRPWQFSLMWKEESPFVQALIEYFETHDIRDTVGFNEPYSGKTIRAQTTEYYADIHHLPTAIFEVRQDLLSSQEGVEYWSGIIQAAVYSAMQAVQIQR